MEFSANLVIPLMAETYRGLVCAGESLRALCGNLREIAISEGTLMDYAGRSCGRRRRILRGVFGRWRRNRAAFVDVPRFHRFHDFPGAGLPAAGYCSADHV